MYFLQRSQGGKRLGHLDLRRQIFISLNIPAKSQVLAKT